MNHGDTDEYRRCKISHQPPATLCSFRESWWGNTLKNSSPLCKSSLCSSPFLLLPEQLPSWKLSLFLLPHLDFPSSAFKGISPVSPALRSVCLLFLMLPASSTIHRVCCPLHVPASKSPLLAGALDSSLSSLSPFSSKALPPAESSFDSDSFTGNGKRKSLAVEGVATT